MKIPNINELYKDNWGRNQGDTEAKETPDYWSKMAELFSKKAHSVASRKETIQFLNKFNWSKNETVLDVAAGPGTHSIPLSNYVKHITATDFSSEMLNQLQKKAKEENVTNIETICGRWLELEFNQKFNTVLCLNSLGVITSDSNHESHLIKTLKKLDSLALNRLIVLIPHADTALDNKMLEILEVKETPLERHRIAVLYYAMVDSGMLPSLEILSRPFHWVFSSIEEATDKMLMKSNLKECSQDKIVKLQDYLKSILQSNNDGTFSLSYNTKQALFTYIKD